MKDKINTTIRRHDLIWNKFKKDNTPQPSPTIENLKKIQTETIDLEQLTEEDKKYLIENGESILYNDISGLYGGDQSAPYNIYYYTEVENYYEGKWSKWTANQIEKIVKSYFPDMTDEELVDYLYAMNNVGCGYVEVSNAIFESYIDKPEKFEHDFGFPMYYKCDDGTFVSNVNLLFVNVYCNTYKNGITGYAFATHLESIWDSIPIWGNDKKSDIKYYPGDLEHNQGTSRSDREAILEYYKKNYGVDVSFSSIEEEILKEYKKNYDNSGLFFNGSLKKYFEHYDSFTKYSEFITSEYLQITNTAISNTVKKGDNVGIAASDYTLYLVDENNNRIPTDEGLKKVDAPHAMTIVDINDNGDYIVSTWGGKYALDPMSLDPKYEVYKIIINGGSK